MRARLHRVTRRSQPLRLWWALPTFAFGAFAVGLGVVVGPTLGEHVRVPRELVLAAPTPVAPSPAATTTSTPSRRDQQEHTAQPLPAPRTTATAAPQSPTPAPTLVQQTHVVTPQRPVVTASTDDVYEHESGSRDSESGDQ